MTETTTALEPLTLTLDVLPKVKLLNANDARGHWAKRAPWIKYWRRMAWIETRNRITRREWPLLERAHVTVTITWPDNRRRDPANWEPTAKAIVDGITTAGLWPDDDDKHVTGPDMRRGHGPHAIHIQIQPVALRAPRTHTPTRELRSGRREMTVQRACNGCGQDIGDATPAELDCAGAGIDLPDVRQECPRCSTPTPPATPRGGGVTCCA